MLPKVLLVSCEAKKTNLKGKKNEVKGKKKGGVIPREAPLPASAQENVMLLPKVGGREFIISFIHHIQCLTAISGKIGQRKGGKQPTVSAAAGFPSPHLALEQRAQQHTQPSLHPPQQPFLSFCL